MFVWTRKQRWHRLSWNNSIATLDSLTLLIKSESIHIDDWFQDSLGTNKGVNKELTDKQWHKTLMRKIPNFCYKVQNQKV